MIIIMKKIGKARQEQHVRFAFWKLVQQMQNPFVPLHKAQLFPSSSAKISVSVYYYHYF